MKIVRTLMFVGLLSNLICFPMVTLAQTGEMGTFRQNFATVIFSGLGGAVLGLSTLSFYGEPQEHIGNIWTGLALGIIGGSAYVVQKATDNRAATTIETDKYLSISNPNKMTKRVPDIISYQISF